MTNKIKDLPTDSYPITNQEKDLTAKFFTPIEEEKEVKLEEKFKKLLYVVALMFACSFPQVDTIFINQFGDKSNMAKMFFIMVASYILLKINILKL